MSDPFPGLAPATARQRDVAVRGDEQGTRGDREASFGQDRVAHVRRIALDHGLRPVSGRAHRAEAAFPHGHPQAAAADDQDRGTRGQALGEHARGGLGGGHDVLRGGGDAEAGQQLGDGGGCPVGVVRHVGQPQARRVGLAERLGRSGDRGAAQVDRSVQVEQRDIVGGIEGLGTAAQRPRAARHRCAVRPVLLGAQGGADRPQGFGVVRGVGSHRGGEGQVLGCGGVMPGPGQGQPEAEVRVVVRRARLHDHPEVVGRLRVPASVELGPGQGLPHAARGGFGCRGELQHLSRCRGAAAAEKFHATPVPGVHISFRNGLAREVLFRTGITARS